eukprot:TRINITY_DN34826_c0_g1_i3.p3 TRINITY_DN34826_c0_g1~~TRINITY_DN34826_c0_g1_i3.p3  ORF type:complete len:118 (-),score=14.09 TRINITY_DN34826_c0_g1_i3:30-383(-)
MYRVNFSNLNNFDSQKNWISFFYSFFYILMIINLLKLLATDIWLRLQTLHLFPLFVFEKTQNLSLIHISEPTRPLYISYAVFCLKKKKTNPYSTKTHHQTYTLQRLNQAHNYTLHIE